jgi:hypothetical protein
MKIWYYLMLPVEVAVFSSAFFAKKIGRTEESKE